MGFKTKLATLILLISLITIINGKIYYNYQNTNLLLLVYGVTVTAVVLFTLLITRLKYKDPYEILDNDKKINSTKPLISCVLAVYNENIVIENCINSLLNSTYLNKEIIIVNDASTDNTEEVLESFAKYPEIKIINLKKNVGKKKAISEGLKIAKGELFVFTDSDSVIAEDAIEKIITIFANDPLVGAVSGHGRVLNANENILTKIQDSWYETQFSIEKAFESVFDCVTCVSGPLAVFRREAIYNYIPAWKFDKFLGKEFRFATDRQLTGYVLGSVYLGKKLKEQYKFSPFVYEINYEPKPWKVIYCKSAKVWTVVPNTLKKIIRQHIRWKKSFIRNLFFTGTFYWRKPIIPALKFYLGAMFTIFGPFIALRHLIYLPLQGNLLSAIYYLSGIFFIGSIYAIVFKLDNPKSRIWIYRPLMSLLSTLVLSWLIFISALTIKKKIWYRG